MPLQGSHSAAGLCDSGAMGGGLFLERRAERPGTLTDYVANRNMPASACPILKGVAEAAGWRRRLGTTMTMSCALFRRRFGHSDSAQTVAFESEVYAGIFGRTAMRKVFALVILVLGALAGLLSAADDNWGTRIVMIGVGLLFTAPVAGAVAMKKRRGGVQLETDWPDRPVAGQGVSARDLVANYWRDQGHAPFTKPPDVPPDKHQFDPNRVV